MKHRAKDVAVGTKVKLPDIQTAGLQHLTSFTVDKIVVDWPEAGYLTWHDYVQMLSLEIRATDYIEVIELP